MTLTCCYCGGPIVKSRTPAHTEEVLVQGHSQIERAWHRACEPLAIPPDSPFQAALQKAKQAIEDARRLPAEEFDAFTGIVALALREQR